MPLLVSDYSWTQTDSTVHVHVPLKGAKAERVDLVSTDQYLKVHYPPYLFEAFLLEPVDDDKSSAKVGNGVAVIHLTKRDKKVWDRLMINTDDKDKKREIREQALLKYQEKLLSESKSKKEKQQADKKYALETMMRLEKEERDSIQKTKEEERARTTAELEAWQRTQRQRAEDEAELCRQGDDGNDEKVSTEKQETERNVKSGVREVRRTGTIQVTFTPRVFPTALRESRVEEEEAWLRKQAEARRAVNADVDELADLKDEDRNPDSLKDKGDKRFAAGDFLSAVNIYNLAIRLNGKTPALFSNRAACHLKLRNLHKAVEDSSQALDLLTPPVAANAAARARAHVRRGSAFCQLQLYTEGLQDFQAALRIDPHNEALQEDAQRIRDFIQGTETQ